MVPLSTDALMKSYLSIGFLFLDGFYEELDLTLLHFLFSIFMDVRASEIAVENIDCIFNDASCYNGVAPCIALSFRT